MTNKRKINISNNHRLVLYAEFPNTSRATINNALAYRYDSKISIRIRERAIELLEQEVKEAKQRG